MSKKPRKPAQKKKGKPARKVPSFSTTLADARRNASMQDFIDPEVATKQREFDVTFADSRRHEADEPGEPGEPFVTGVYPYIKIDPNELASAINSKIATFPHPGAALFVPELKAIKPKEKDSLVRFFNKFWPVLLFAGGLVVVVIIDLIIKSAGLL